MLKDIFETVWSKALQTKARQFLESPTGDKNVFYELQGDGSYLKVKADPAPRCHTVANLETLVALIVGTPPDRAEVWFDRKGVVAILDSTYRRDKAVMPLEMSPQMQLLIDLEKSKAAFSQKDLIRWMRVHFADCLGLCGNIISLIRTVKFVVDQSGESEIGHGKSSVGKSLKSELTSTDKLPETLTFTVPVFKRGFRFMAQVVLVLEIDVSNQHFYLLPKTGAIEAAITEGEAALGGHLANATKPCPVYNGNP